MSTTATLATLSDPIACPIPTGGARPSVYQIYPRSFADSNGDGLGDIKGITAKVPYLKELGIDAVWLSPFYPSALADGGYDVDDYRDVDPKLGTLEDFAEMSTALHDAGIKLIADIVPNHSSNRHVWFQEALAAPQGFSGPRALHLPRWPGPQRRRSRRRTGTQCLAAPPGSASPNRTAPPGSGTCTSSPRSSRT